MKKQTKILKILNIERLKNSCYGNPNFLVVLVDSDNFVYHAKTKSNSAIGYMLDTCYIGKTKKFTYHFTKNGNMILDYCENVE